MADHENWALHTKDDGHPAGGRGRRAGAVGARA